VADVNHRFSKESYVSRRLPEGADFAGPVVKLSLAQLAAVLDAVARARPEAPPTAAPPHLGSTAQRSARREVDYGR
jgi:hypothetical protein